MKVNPKDRVIELTRTNLMTLLAKLDGHPPDSMCTIGGGDDQFWWVKAVEDKVHYSDRERGAMHEETEKVLRLSWTLVICDPCWVKQHGDRVPVRFKDPDEEIPLQKCSYCGEMTDSGIWVRDDPAHVAFPRPKDE